MSETALTAGVSSNHRNTGMAAYELWHRRLAHLGVSSTVNIHHYVDGVEPFHGQGHSNSSLCSHCLTGKQTRQPFKPSASRATRPLELVHTDLAGPFPASLGGGRYWLVLVDDYSRYTSIYIIRSKSDAFAIYKQWESLVERFH